MLKDFDTEPSRHRQSLLLSVAPLYLFQLTRARRPLPAVPACTAPDSGCVEASDPCIIPSWLSSHQLKRAALRRHIGLKLQLPALNKESLHSLLIMNILVVINSLFILFYIPFG